ncbi:hypothetical protein DL769_008779 [Monosporascus sp. CRB-8-3]|nr:hypothetical protein DL769_008779 [Monosporascus sp. CRB-8-3]
MHTAAAIAIDGPSPRATSFSFGFSGESYTPFEGAGAISTWQINLAPELRSFDYRTISDTVLHLRSTAALAQTASEATFAALQQASQPSPPALLISAPSDFATGWSAFQAAVREGGDAQLGMSSLDRFLPFWMRRMRATVQNISVLFFPDPSAGIDVTKLAIKEYPGLDWKKGQHAALAGSALVVEVNGVNKALAPDWLVTLPGNGTGAEVDALWFVVRYSVDREAV